MLRESGVPVIELRASIVIGAGSLSFEMVRSLVERLPVMVCPKWVAVKAQPIAVDDVLAYLAAAAEDETSGSVVCEIGGPDVVSYGDIMREYARQRGLKRLLIPVPLLTPRLSSLWLRLVTPLYASVGRWLIDGMRNQTIVTDAEPARRYALKPRGLMQAVTEATRQRGERVEALLAEAAGPDADAALTALRASGCLLDHRETVGAGEPGARVRAREDDWRGERLLLRQPALDAARVVRPPRWAESGCGGAGATRTPAWSGTPWTSGVSWRSSRTGA